MFTGIQLDSELDDHRMLGFLGTVLEKNLVALDLHFHLESVEVRYPWYIPGIFPLM